MTAEPAPIEVGVYQAKTHLSQLLDQVAAGKTICITRHGRTAALLSPAPHLEPLVRRPFGGWEDYALPEGWDEFTTKDELDWYGHVDLGQDQTTGDDEAKKTGAKRSEQPSA